MPASLKPWLLRLSLALAAAGLLLRFAFHDPAISANFCILLQAPLAVFWWMCGGGVRGATGASAGGLSRGAAWILSLCVAGVAAWTGSQRGWLIGAALFSLYAIGVSAADGFAGQLAAIERLASRPVRLAGRVAVVWLLLVVVGTGLLFLPGATHRAVPNYYYSSPRHCVTAAFTAASAVSLNGVLSAFGLQEELEPFGRGVVFALMLAGATLFGAVGLITLRPWLSLPIRLRHFLLSWLAVQALCGSIMSADAEALGGEAGSLWTGIFHAAAAANQTGFSLRQDGAAEALHHNRLFWTMLALAGVGGIGPLVLVDRAWLFLRGRVIGSGAQPPSAVPAGDGGSGSMRMFTSPAARLLDLTGFELHAGIWIICLAAAAIWFCESPGRLPDSMQQQAVPDLGPNQLPLRDMQSGTLRWRASLMLSTMSRSGGMAVAPLPFGAISWPTWIVLIGCMLIGGGVGSAAGGLRTGMAAVLLAAPRLWRAGLSRVVWIALLTTAASALLVLVAWAVLRLMVPESNVFDSLFDAVSLSTATGLTTGLTPIASPWLRLYLLPILFLGRMIPVAGWLAMAAAMPVGGRPIHQET